MAFEINSFWELIVILFKLGIGVIVGIDIFCFICYLFGMRE